MPHLTEAQYKIIAYRMVEEHRKYGDKLPLGHWADIAARKVAGHMADFRADEEVVLVNGRCMRCDYDAMDRSDNLLPTPHKFCPNCGIRVKQTNDAKAVQRANIAAIMKADEESGLYDI